MEGKHLSFAFLAATQVIPGIGNDVTTQGGPEKPILKCFPPPEAGGWDFFAHLLVSKMGLPHMRMGCFKYCFLSTIT